MPLATTTRDVEISDLKRTLKFVNSQNSALINDRDSWRRVAENLETEKQDFAARADAFERYIKWLTANVVQPGSTAYISAKELLSET